VAKKTLGGWAVIGWPLGCDWLAVGNDWRAYLNNYFATELRTQLGRRSISHAETSGDSGDEFMLERTK